jgi:hypothetical protein
VTRTTGLRLRGALRRALDALLWAVLAALGAPVVLALGVTIVSLARGDGAGAIVGGLYMLVVGLFVSVAFALAPYSLLLLAWSALAPRLGAAETRAGVVVATAALTLPAGVVMVLANDGPTLVLFAPIWISAWIGLLLPRLVVPRLAPGAFARDHAPLRPEPSGA